MTFTEYKQDKGENPQNWVIIESEDVSNQHINEKDKSFIFDLVMSWGESFRYFTKESELRLYGAKSGNPSCFVLSEKFFNIIKNKFNK